MQRNERIFSNLVHPVNPVEMFFDLLINSSVNTIVVTSISEERYFNDREHSLGTPASCGRILGEQNNCDEK